MKEPIIPGYTCPLIDNVISIIEDAYRIADMAVGSDDPDVLNGALREIRHCLYREHEKLEPIRDANLELRNAAKYWMEKATSLSDELVDALGGEK